MTEQGPFPWDGITLRAAQIGGAVFGVVFVVLGAAVTAGRRDERAVLAERARTRWTDEARWDRKR